MQDGPVEPSVAGRAASTVNPNAVLAVVAVAQFMVVLDASIVNVALPTIKNDLHFSEANLSWILNAYTLVFGGFLLLGGRAADLLGRRRLFIAGIALFASASLVCGLAQSSGVLLVFRAVQGLGGAMASPAALSTVLATFAEGPARNRALSVWGAIAGAGGAVGLLLGGVIVQAISWRWIFFINVPIGAAVLAVTPRIVPESRSSGTAGRTYDLGGAVTVTLGTIALVFTLIKADSWGWGSGKTIGGFAIAAALIAAFLVIEHMVRDPLVPLRIFSNRSLTASDVTLLLVGAALFGMFYFCTLYLQQVLGYGPLKTGLSYLPLSATLITSSALAARVVDRYGPKPVLVTGLLISTGGFAVLTRVTGHADYVNHVLPATLIIAVGIGMSFVPVTIAATTGVAPEDSGLASGLLNTTQQVGGSLGLAILSSVSLGRINSALHAGTAVPVALTRGFKAGFTTAGILCAAGAVLAFGLLPRRVREPQDEQVRAVAFAFARCPGAPYCGHLARVAAFGHRVRGWSSAGN